MWRKWRQAGAVCQSPEHLERQRSVARQQVLLATLRAKWRPPPTPAPPAPLTVDQKQRLISQFLNTPGGRQKLAASMTAPLRALRDYVSMGRSLFMPQTLPDGALDLYDREPNPDLRVTNTIKGMLDLLQDPSRI